MSAAVPVSVVVPCFRCANTIGRALASVAAQTARPQAVILVDDASGDTTAETLRSLQANHPAGWVTVITLPVNQGAATARNVGWEAATTRHVAFLDADDSWHPDKLALQYAFMHTHPDVVATGHRFLQAQSDAYGTPSDYPPLATSPLPHHPIVPWQVLLKNPFITPSLMLRTDAPLRFPVGQRHMEDHLLLMQLALRGVPMVRIDLPLACIHKDRYGQAGLSADMHAMHQAELDNLQRLVRDGDLPATAGWVLRGYVRLKFVRRQLLVALRQRGAA